MKAITAFFFLMLCASASMANVGAWQSCVAKYSNADMAQQGWMIVDALTMDVVDLFIVTQDQNNLHKAMKDNCDPLLTPDELKALGEEMAARRSKPFQREMESHLAK